MTTIPLDRCPPLSHCAIFDPRLSLVHQTTTQTYLTLREPLLKYSKPFGSIWHGRQKYPTDCLLCTELPTLLLVPPATFTECLFSLHRSPPPPPATKTNSTPPLRRETRMKRKLGKTIIKKASRKHYADLLYSNRLRTTTTNSLPSTNNHPTIVAAPPLI